MKKLFYMEKLRRFHARGNNISLVLIQCKEEKTPFNLIDSIAGKTISGNLVWFEFRVSPNRGMRVRR